MVVNLTLTEAETVRVRELLDHMRAWPGALSEFPEPTLDELLHQALHQGLNVLELWQRRCELKERTDRP